MEDRILTDDEVRVYGGRLAKLLYTLYDRVGNGESVDDLRKEFAKLRADLMAAKEKPVIAPQKPKKALPRTDKEQFEDFVSDTFGKIGDKIIAKGSQYTGRKPVLDAIYEQTKRRIDKDVVTAGNMLHTILMLSDKHQVALLQHGRAAGDVEDRLTDIIVYSLLALYLLSPQAEAYYGTEG